MIVTDLSGFGRYAGLHPKFFQLIEFINSHDLLNEELGRIELDGDELFVNNVNIKTLTAEEQQLEIHKEYIDVHMVLSGHETIGWKDTGKLEHPSKEYDPKSDCAMYTDRPTCYVDLSPGDIVVCFPEDAHAPAIGEGEIRKIIAKIRV